MIYDAVMRRVSVLRFFLFWAIGSLLLTLIAFLPFANDRMDLIDQAVLPTACDAFLRMKPSSVVYSEWAFALRCWDPARVAVVLGSLFFISAISISLLTLAIAFFVVRKNQNKTGAGRQ